MKRVSPIPLRTRRDALKWLGGASLFAATGCVREGHSGTTDATEVSDDIASDTDTTSAEVDDTSPELPLPDTDSPDVPDIAPDLADDAQRDIFDASPDVVDTSPDGDTASEWARGGTAAMTAKASYPNPHEVPPSGCELFIPTTAGPCTTALQLDREDVSEGRAGLPVRLSLRIVDSDCTPRPGLVVRIWHTTIEGSYTGETPNNRFCVLDPTLASTNAFRGYQTTDVDGVVAFDTCFPGWYPGRAIHIHFEIRDSDRSLGISQIFFPEDLTTAIFAAHPDYVIFGQPNTIFSNDGVIRGIPESDRSRHLLEIAKMVDGAMLASKTLVIT